MDDKKLVGERGKNRNKYHFQVFNDLDDTNGYFFTLQDICDAYKISRSSANNILTKKPTHKYKHLRIERTCIPVVQVELGISDDDMAKYLPQLL